MKRVILFLALILVCESSYGANPVIDKIENSLYGYTYSSESDASRLSRIEKDVYGKENSGQIAARINKLKKDVRFWDKMVHDERNRNAVSYVSKRAIKLLKKIAEFDSFVNPFSNNALVLKDPIEYIDRLKLSIRYTEDDEETFARFYLEEESIEIKYDNDPDGWTYNTLMYVQRNGLNGCINLIHYYEKGDKSKPADEVIYLDYDANRKSYDDHPDDIDLRISLKTGLAWKTYHEEEAAPVTDEQVKLMLTHLNMCIKRIKSSIIRYMIKES